MTLKCSTEMRYEIRTSKALTRTFDDLGLAKRWLELQELIQPKYAKSLKIFKVTIHTSVHQEEIR